MVFLTIFFIPLILSIISWLTFKRISVKEFLLGIGIQAIIAGISILIIYHDSTSDIEIWNGWIASKQKEIVSCEHSYKCFCHNSCDSKGSCTEHCSTCYEHNHDYDWMLYTSNHESITIPRIDRQGTEMPNRYASAKLWEPTVQEHNYENYIKASPGSLFRHTKVDDKYKDTIPNYPQNIYDYYRIKRLVSNVPLSNSQEWNDGLDTINSLLGQKKQVNIILVLTTHSQDWYYALETAWIGGKKNDVIIVMGVQENRPKWVNIMCWTTSELFKVRLQDSLMKLPEVTAKDTLGIISYNVQEYYKRKPMKDFEYLKSSIAPSRTQYLVTIILGILISIILNYLFVKYDVFNDETYFYRR